MNKNIFLIGFFIGFGLTVLGLIQDGQTAVPTVGVFMIAGAIVGAVFASGRVPEIRIPGQEEPDPNCCRVCGYDARGLTSSTCPECGHAHGVRDGSVSGGDGRV